MKKLPSKYRLTVVDGKLVFSAPSAVQITHSKAPTIEISTPATPTKECRQCKKEFASPKKLRGAPQMYCSKACRTVFNNRKYYMAKHPQKSAGPGEVTCPQCETTFMWERGGRSGRKKYCSAKCREEFFNAKYKQERSERLEKTPRTISCDHIAPTPAASQYIPCKECNNTFLKGRANQVFCKKDCRISFFANKYLPEKVTGTFVERVNKALATLPPEENLPPPMPEDTAAASLLAAGRTLTPLGLVEAVQDIYGINVAEERPRPKAFWFSVLLARHSKTLEEWKKLLGKHGLVSNPKIEKWLLFRAGASSPATAGRLKAQLGI